MFNGIDTISTKGTGLSGFVQRSKANINTSQLAKFRSAEADDTLPTESVNPLLQKRTQKENTDLERRLAVHRAIRAVRLKVFLYREERLAAGVEEDLVEKECDEMYKVLMEVAVETQRQEQKVENSKSAERFAAAFGVKVTDTSSFDRVKREEERQARMEEMMAQREHQLVERLKKIKDDN